MKHVRSLLFVIGLLVSCFFFYDANAQPKYECRAVWIATVNNIDWPSQKGLPVLVQKLEFVQILDSLQNIGINTIIVQVRPVADAFYDSPYEPWSEYLTGIQGLKPVPYYDPMAFMIEEAHKRNMEFHAWLNPYRAVFDVKNSSISSNHITKKHPEWFVIYGNKKYFNPGLPQVMDFVTDVVKDIVSRYNVDAIHMDDYFYPYRIAGKEFPDNAAYLKYGHNLTKSEWRRSNCDSIIRKIHDAIIKVKPVVKFGISPFGVWRNIDQDADGSNTKAGQTNYDDLYADILLWLKEGWIDYVAPQLYWEIGHKLADYETLLAWWGKHAYGKHVYIGHGIYRVYESPNAAWRNANEIPNQIKILRKNPNIQGSIYFSNANLLRNPNGWADSLRLNYYKTPAIVPAMPWIDNIAPIAPIIENYKQGKNKNEIVVDVKRDEDNESEVVKSYVIYITGNVEEIGKTPSLIQYCGNAKKQSITIPFSKISSSTNECYIAISCLDTENNESPCSNVVQLIKTNSGWMIPR